MKGRRTPSARMRKVMSRRITGRRRRGENVGNVRPTERGRVRFRTDDRNVFWLRYTARAREPRGGGRERTKKKERRNRVRARIYRVTLSGLFQRRPESRIGTVVIFPVATFYQKLARARARSYFSSHPLRIFVHPFISLSVFSPPFLSDVVLLREI